MKAQNGGLQTFLRNHRYIFEVKNTVELRVPSPYPKPSSDAQPVRKSYKSKNCFFHFHHPQGCPLVDSDCSYSHEDLES
ncbi:putative tRNA-methyltransferase [Trichonephila clavata]|uniref:Putative tRNA-methyltransferase n=1 Tax=Trichonephila clavata TaxID=2740835 RepID=A0A8X6HI06_TRICU|nr:putative tRNA-methyltransferase [Trichonephila clavata]